MQETQDHRFQILLEQEIQKVMALIEKTQEQNKSRLVTTEQFTKGQIDKVYGDIRDCERQISRMATESMMDKITEDNKSIKAKFQEEFNQFQEWLKDQNTRFNSFNTKIRMFEKSVKGLGDT